LNAKPKLIIAGLDPGILCVATKEDGRDEVFGPGMMDAGDDATPAPQVAHFPKMQQASLKGR
jgi:hypothetical protein